METSSYLMNQWLWHPHWPAIEAAPMKLTFTKARLGLPWFAPITINKIRQQNNGITTTWQRTLMKYRMNCSTKFPSFDSTGTQNKQKLCSNKTGHDKTNYIDMGHTWWNCISFDVEEDGRTKQSSAPEYFAPIAPALSMWAAMWCDPILYDSLNWQTYSFLPGLWSWPNRPNPKFHSARFYKVISSYS